jgi:hypothetical protein
MTCGHIRQPSFFPSYTLHLHFSKSLGQSATLYMRALTQVLYMGIICSNSNAISSQAGTIHWIKSALHDCYYGWRKIKYSILFYSKAKRNSSLFFRFFSLFCAIFRFFFAFFALNFSLCFDLVILLRSETKQSEIQVYFFHFFRFFSLFFAFSLNFRFASIFSLNFRLFYLRFCFRFLVFRIEVNHVKSGFFFASKRNEIFASISNFASEAKVRAHPRREY